MLAEQVVINASPLIVLFKSQQVDLLPQLFSEILIPRGVAEEISAGARGDMVSLGLFQAEWAKVIDIGSVSREVAAWDLGKGESEVLSFAAAVRSKTIAIVDDRAARRCGSSLGIPTLGTGGVLVLAKRRGLISEVLPRLQALQNAGLWMSAGVVELLKEQAGE